MELSGVVYDRTVTGEAVRANEWKCDIIIRGKKVGTGKINFSSSYRYEEPLGEEKGTVSFSSFKVNEKAIDKLLEE